MIPLPAGWLDYKLVELYCVEDEGNGKKRLTTAAIDCPVLWLKFRKELYPALTVSKYRGALRRLCFDHGAGYHLSPLRPDLRRLLADRINELGKKRWTCFKKPTTEQQSLVDNTLTLRAMLLIPAGNPYDIQGENIDSNPGNSNLESICIRDAKAGASSDVDEDGVPFANGDFTAALAALSGIDSTSQQSALEDISGSNPNVDVNDSASKTNAIEKKYGIGSASAICSELGASGSAASASASACDGAGSCVNAGNSASMAHNSAVSGGPRGIQNDSHCADHGGDFTGISGNANGRCSVSADHAIGDCVGGGGAIIPDPWDAFALQIHDEHDADDGRGKDC